MPLLTSRTLFSGGEAIHPNDLGNAEVLNFTTSIPTLDIFSFDNGGLWSNIVPSASIVHSFHKTSTGEVVLADERNEQGVGNFSARMNCQLSSSSDGRRGIVVKFVILLFPAAADELADAPEIKFAGWPGIKLYEYTFPVVPKPTVPWQCPIIPFLRPGVPFSDLATAPSGSRLRAAVSAIMLKCSQPEVLENGRSVTRR
jgi:hypothetical protein